MLKRLKSRWFIYAAIIFLVLPSLVVNWERTDAFAVTVLFWVWAAACALFWNKNAGTKQTRQEEGIEAIEYQHVASMSTSHRQQISIHLDGLTIRELENLSNEELSKGFQAWTERASLPSYPADHAGDLGNRLAVLNSAVLNDPILQWSQSWDEFSLESCSEFLRGYWNCDGPLDLRVVKSLFDFAGSKPLDDRAWYLSVLLALAEAFKRGARTEGLKELLQRYESECRENQPGFSDILAESLASNRAEKIPPQ